jgi:hypothetical protein
MTIAAIANMRLKDVVLPIAADLGLTQLNNYTPSTPPAPQPREPERQELNDDEKSLITKLLKGSYAIQPTDLVWKYLLGRGLPVALLNGISAEGKIRFHPRIYHYPTETWCPAMIVAVTCPQGKVKGVHRTYLAELNGKVTKLNHKNNRLLTGAYPNAYVSSRVELGLHQGSIGIAVGIETALAVNALGYPCWSVINTAGMKSFVPPPGTQEVLIFGDNDVMSDKQLDALRKKKERLNESITDEELIGDGQKAALKLKARLLDEGYNVKAFIPEPLSQRSTGYDWLDFYNERSSNVKTSA